MFGVLAINKPAGWTSRDVVNRVQRLIRPVKVGHTGTLDPLATGVLLLAVGSASRLVEFAHAQSKGYTADFDLGRSSPTLDSDGPVRLLQDAYHPTLQELQTEAAKWMGEVEQIPPKFSAIHHQGARAYDLARQGKAFDLPARQVVIHRLDIVDYAYPRFSAHVECGSGTYIRSLGSDIARGLGSDAVMSGLVRTRIGPFTLADCVELESLTQAEQIARLLHPPQMLLLGQPFIELSEDDVKRIRNGLPLDLEGPMQDLLVAVDANQELVAIVQRTAEGNYRSRRVFHSTSETAQPNSNNPRHSPES